MKQTKTYTSRPPVTARAARRAWDHFERTKATPHRREIEELFYSPNYEYTGCPHWVCTLAMREEDTMHWRFSTTDLMFAEPSYRLANGA